MEKQLPKNWVEAELENLFDLVYGKGLSVKELTEDGYDVYGANGIIGKFTNYLYENPKVVISCRGAASGAIHKTNSKSFITSNSIVLNEIFSDLINLDFIKHVMTNADKSGVITGTAQPQITIQLLKDLKIPLPPLPEQHRIVAKLDTLFAQLETIKASMANIPLLLKDFRQQVLTQAVTGKLTNCKVEEKRLGDLLIDVKYGTSMKSEYEIDGTPIFRIPNINDGEINDKDLKYSILEKKEYNQLKLVEGDVLIIRSNGSVSLVGRSAIIREKHIGYAYAGYLIRLRCGEELNPDFLNYTLKSDFLRTQIVNTSHSSSGVNNINSQEIKDLKLFWTSTKEQQEIVSRVESLFAKADAIEQQYKTLKASIDNLPQALLHKAFKGELMPQLESDGDARELLEEIQELKGARTKVAKNTKLEKLKVFNKKVKKYPKSEDILGMVAEPNQNIPL